MRYIAIILLLLPFLSLGQFSEKQLSEIDSLITIITNNSKHDTSIAKAYIDLSDILYISNKDTIYTLCHKAKSITENALSKCKNCDQEIIKSFKKTLAEAYTNIGYYYGVKGDIEKQIEHYHKGLKLNEEINYKYGIATSYNNIGYVYRNQNNYNEALEYYFKSLKIREELNSKSGIGLCLSNIGFVYNILDSTEKALDYYNKSLAIRKEVGNPKGISNSYNNLTYVYEKMGNTDKALEYYNLALVIREEIGSKIGICYSLSNIANLERKKGDYKSARKKLERVYKLATESGSPETISLAARNLSTLAKNEGDFKEAYEMYRLHIQMQDSIESKKTQKAVIEQQAKYEYEKKEAVRNKEFEKQMAIEQKEKEKQQLIAYSTSIGLFLVFVFSIFMFNRYRITKKQKIIIEKTNNQLNQTNEELATQRDFIEEQKIVVEEAHNEIKESINYAKRIQTAILPPNNKIKENLPHSFILYKPKDVVAGDFYWLEKIDNTTLIAAADCTGHGVPGAMVSVVCHNALNRSIREYKLTKPSNILDKTRDIVLEELSKSSEDVKDGMDIALCAIKEKTLQYAGANNPLLIIRNNEIIEIKADKQPIGKFDKSFPFTNHTIELEKNDSIYMFSDGFTDQFGGEKDKKFGSKKLKELLASIHSKTMDEQLKTLDTTITNWISQGKSNQIDDICLIGVKI